MELKPIAVSPIDDASLNEVQRVKGDSYSSYDDEEFFPDSGGFDCGPDEAYDPDDWPEDNGQQGDDMAGAMAAMDAPIVPLNLL